MAASTLPTLIPWGRLSDGKVGINLDDATGVQLNSVVEVWGRPGDGSDGIDPNTVSGDNFDGRMVFMLGEGVVYIWDPTKGPGWRELGTLPATVGVTDPGTGLPPISPPPQQGELFWATDTEVCYVWDGTRWQPIGGRYAGYFKSVYYPSVSGIKDTFALGLTVTEIDSLVGADQNVEAYIDGVRQSYAAGEYYIAGGNLKFTTPPAAGTNVYIRTLVSDVIAPTADVEAYHYDSSTPPPNRVDGVNTTFELGSSGVNRTGTSVYIDGVHQKSEIDDPSSPDYTITSQDTTITTLTVNPGGSTTVEVATLAPHNAVGGEQIVIDGVTTEPGYNGTFQIQSIIDPNTFTVTNPLGPTLVSPIADPGMFFTPPILNDVLNISPPVPGTSEIVVRVVRNLVATESTGEVNAGVNIGAGEPIYKDKLGLDLRFRSLLAGSNISIVDTGGELLISAASGLSYEDRNGINMTYHLVTTESYVGVLVTASPVVIDLSNIVDVVDAGRRVVIKDESGAAAINNITIIHPGKLFDGGPNWVISSNYGSVTLVFSGSNWYSVGGGAGVGASGVTSFNGRNGVVLPLAGDYNAVKIAYSPVSSGLVATDVQNAIDEVVATFSGVIPTGTLVPFAGSEAVIPPGWIVADGKTIGNNLSGAQLTGPQYENLFNVVKTMAGINTGAEIFAANDLVLLPDLRGRVPFGPDSMGGTGAGRIATSAWMADPDTPGASGGEDQHTLTESEMPRHRHRLPNGENDASAGGSDSNIPGDPGAIVFYSEYTGGDLPHNTLPPLQIINWIIKL